MNVCQPTSTSGEGTSPRGPWSAHVPRNARAWSTIRSARSAYSGRSVATRAASRENKASSTSSRPWIGVAGAVFGGPRARGLAAPRRLIAGAMDIELMRPAMFAAAPDWQTDPSSGMVFRLYDAAGQEVADEQDAVSQRAIFVDLSRYNWGVARL